MLLDASTLLPLLVLQGRGARAIHVRELSFTSDDSSLLVFTESKAVRFDLSAHLDLASATASPDAVSMGVDDAPLQLTGGETFMTRPKVS